MNQPSSTVSSEERIRRTMLINIRQKLMAPADAIIGYAELLREQSSHENLDEMLPDLDRVLEASRTLSGMVDNLLADETTGELIHAENLAAAQQKIRHDLRNPINGIKGYGEMLLEDLADFNAQHLRPDIEKLLGEANQLHSQLDQIVDFTQAGDIGLGPGSATDQAMVTELLKSIKPVETEAPLPELNGYILVVDDMESNRDVLSRRLLRDGHRVAMAENGIVALKMLNDDQFDLVLLDLIMPGLNGFEVLAEMKKDDDLKAIPVIMVSALDETDSVIRCIEAGADDYLPKPINPVLLRARIKSGLEKKAWQDNERQQKQFIRQAFSRYISPDVVDQLVDDPKRLSLGGERQDITCVFTDLAGFTALMETTEPSEALPVLNAYFDGMCAIVRDHGGTIDKIVGDALHVFFGAPLAMPDHPEKAVKCAIDMDAFARKFEKSEEALSVAFGRTRIGVHSGLAVVGNFGGETFFDYTAHGDTVNTAARMESVNAYLGTGICISGDTASRCESVLFRPVGSLVLKGKTHPVEAFEPVSELNSSCYEAYMETYDLIRRSSPEATRQLKGLRKKFPNDPLIRFHSERLAKGKTGTMIKFSGK